MSEYIFKLPDLGEGTVESEIGEWLVKVGDAVAEEDVVGTMMTDKAAVEISSPVSGTVVKLAGEPGDMIAVGAPLVVFDTNAAGSEKAPKADAAAPPAAQKKTAPKKKQAAPAVDTGSRVVTSPAIRRRAKEAGVDLAQVPGSGPGGRILRDDFDNYLEQQGKPLTPSAPTRETKEIKVIGVRRMIAERMTQSKREIPHFAYVEEIDITELESLRQHLNAQRASSRRLTLLPLLSAALIRALDKFPQCNATYDKERNVIVQHGPVHLGIATQTADGLKVPVVKNAQHHSLDQLSDEIRRVTTAARDNTIRRDELSGSTITVTSLGKLGGIVTTPVINMPEVSIIGVNRAIEKPVVVNGQIAVRLTMNLSSSFDHRFVDGSDAAEMIQHVRGMLEHPATIFMHP
ncbi:MAG: 2-oxo acid dehydrogenase subunit E2 [Woeseia sp.]|nr:2-oxo acid dehydrogenase subunit E2 [Woeseia sp.]